MDVVKRLDYLIAGIDKGAVDCDPDRDGAPKMESHDRAYKAGARDAYRHAAALARGIRNEVERASR